jgi:hypothetical protein
MLKMTLVKRAQALGHIVGVYVLIIDCFSSLTPEPAPEME